LCNFLNSGFKKASEYVEIIAKNVLYYNKYEMIKLHNPKELVFYKLNDYKIEDEYRIAIFFPFDDKTTVEASSGERKRDINIFDYDLYHFGINDYNSFKKVILEVRKNNGSIIKL